MAQGRLLSSTCEAVGRSWPEDEEASAGTGGGRCPGQRGQVGMRGAGSIQDRMRASHRFSCLRCPVPTPTLPEAPG